MIPASRTSIVYNNPSKLFGLNPFYYRVRTCDSNLTSNTPASQYQRLKLIQNTVRVYASLYTSNLGPLSAYQKPGPITYNVGWNQMSDRVEPSVQKTIVPTGRNCTLNNRHYSVTSSRPGGQSPGGVGCDIKHNSYDRYLNRLKGKGPLRRGVIPQNFGSPVIPFNPAFPVYGGKTTKTNIVSGCDCPIQTTTKDITSNLRIYNNPYWKPYPNANFVFSVGEYVYAIQEGDQYFTRALITKKDGEDIFTIQFDNGTIEIQSSLQFLVYFPCNCGGLINGNVYDSGFYLEENQTNYGNQCIAPEYIYEAPVFI